MTSGCRPFANARKSQSDSRRPNLIPDECKSNDTRYRAMLLRIPVPNAYRYHTLLKAQWAYSNNSNVCIRDGRDTAPMRMKCRKSCTNLVPANFF